MNFSKTIARPKNHLYPKRLVSRECYEVLNKEIARSCRTGFSASFSFSPCKRIELDWTFEISILRYAKFSEKNMLEDKFIFLLRAQKKFGNFFFLCGNLAESRDFYFWDRRSQRSWSIKEGALSQDIKVSVIESLKFYFLWFVIGTVDTWEDEGEIWRRIVAVGSRNFVDYLQTR